MFSVRVQPTFNAMNPFLLSLAITALLLTGCGKKEAAPAASASPPKSDLESMIGAVKTASQTVSQSVETASAKLEEALPEAAKTATEAANAIASGDVNAMLEQAKKFVGESKIKEATELVQKISSLELTPEQKQLLEEIKAMIQKAAAADPAGAAAGALGNVLGDQK